MTNQTSNTPDSLQEAIKSQLMAFAHKFVSHHDYQNAAASKYHLDAIMQLIESDKAAAIAAARVDTLQQLNMKIIGYKTKDEVQNVITDTLATLRGKE